MLQCLCNHLTSFGGGFLVAPSPIDFDEVFTGFSNLSSTGNIGVIAAVASIVLVYIIGVVLARRADRKDEFRVRKIKLSSSSSLPVVVVVVVVVVVLIGDFRVAFHLCFKARPTAKPFIRFILTQILVHIHCVL